MTWGRVQQVAAWLALAFVSALILAAYTLPSPAPPWQGWIYRSSIEDRDSREVLDAIDKAARDAMIATRDHIRFNDTDKFCVEVTVRER